VAMTTKKTKGGSAELMDLTKKKLRKKMGKIKGGGGAEKNTNIKKGFKKGASGGINKIKEWPAGTGVGRTKRGSNTGNKNGKGPKER